MKLATCIASLAVLLFASAFAGAQANVDLNIGPAGQFCGPQTAIEVKCTINAFFEDSLGNNIGSTSVAFDLKASGLSTVTIAGTSYWVSSPFPSITYPSYPQHPKSTGTLDIVFTDGELVLPYTANFQCNSGRVCAGKDVLTVLANSTLDGESNSK